MNKIRKIPSAELEKIRKILIVQYKPFGDILLNTGYLPALRRKFPEAQIDYLIQKPYVTLLEDNPHLDNLVLMEKKKKDSPAYFLERLRTVLKVRKRNYDVIIDQLRGPGSAQITYFSGAKYKIGWRLKRWNRVYNYLVDRTNLRYYSRLKFDLLLPLGIEEEEHNIYYNIKAESQQYIDKWLEESGLMNEKLVVISAGSPVKRKQWSLDSFAELGGKIAACPGFKLILLWGPGEKEDTDYISSRMKNTPLTAPPTTFNQAGALLKKAVMYIGNDGGVNHLAAAMETPSIAVFGPFTNPVKWTAWHKDIHFYLRDEKFKDKKDHTFNISPDQVFQKFKEFFKL